MTAKVWQIIAGTALVFMLGLRTSDDARGEVRELEGTIRSIDADRRTITIARKTPKGEKVLDLEVARNAGDVSILKAGDEAIFTYNPEVEVISKIGKGLSEKDQKALKTLEGEWLAFAQEAGGKRMKKDDLQRIKMTLVVTGDRFTLSTTSLRCMGKIIPAPDDGATAFDLVGKFQGGEIKDGSFVVKKESAIIIWAIAEVEDETLRFCFKTGQNGMEKLRPTEYETEEGRPGVSVRFKRVAESAASQP